MNLRTKNSSVQRRNKKNDKALIAYVGVYSSIIVCLFSFVLGTSLYLNGQSEKINKEISIKNLESYKLQREIQNLKIKFENLSRKEHIVSKIKQYNLGLHTPAPFQVIIISSDRNDYYKSNNSRRVAYNNVF